MAPPGKSNPKDKEGVRTQARRTRFDLQIDLGECGDAVRDTFLENFVADDRPRTVAGYWPSGTEIDCLVLMNDLAARGWHLLLPIADTPDQPLRFSRWEPGMNLFKGAHGILVPVETDYDAGNVIPDIALVPLLAYDRVGYRLGQGGGYYDRTLAAWREWGDVMSIGLAYDGQEIDKVPVEPHDQKLDALITEQRVLKFERGYL
jgi:5-formyltetrahydrofolate cyclo-ligase